MAWTLYRVVWRVLSPMHVGAGKVGNLQRTRPYLTGRTLWGALTARLTRLNATDNDRAATGKDYETMGELVRELIIFTYFFPAIHLKPGVDVSALPSSWLVVDGFGVCTPTADDGLLGYLFLDSYASTALNYEWMAALEGSLHEIEMIRPCTRPLRHTCLKGLAAAKGADDLGAPVHLLGYLFVNEKAPKGWDVALHRLQVGGERGYGWGRLKLPRDGLQKRDNKSLFGLYKVKDGTWPPQLKIKKGSYLLSHALAIDFDDEHRAVSEVEGTVEPLVGRETRTDGHFGVHLSRVRICWTPGSRAITEANAQIGPYGVWEGIE